MGETWEVFRVLAGTETLLSDLDMQKDNKRQKELERKSEETAKENRQRKSLPETTAETERGETEKQKERENIEMVEQNELR